MSRYTPHRASRSSDNWRLANTRIILVVGPPGAGKTTYVDEHAIPSDVIVDYDELARALGAPGHDRGDHGIVSAARNAVITCIRRGEVNATQVWIVSANPHAEQTLPWHKTVTLDPGRDEVLRRCQQAARPERWTELVDEWYRQRSGEGVKQSRDW